VTGPGILLWLVGLYLLEAATRARKGEVVLVGLPGGRFEIASQGLCIRALFPGAEVLRGDELPLLVTDKGVWHSDVCPRNPGRWPDDTMEGYCSFEATGRVAVRGRSVTVDGRVLLTAGSTQGATQLSDFLVGLRDLGRDGRRAAFDSWLSRRFDLAAAQELRTRATVFVKLLQGVAVVLFLMVFVVIPLSLTSWAMSVPTLESALAGIVLLHCSALCLTGMALHCGGVPRREVRRHLLGMALQPLSSMIAVAQVSQRIYGAFDPATLGALALSPRVARRDLMRRIQGIETVLQRDNDAERTKVWERLAAAHLSLLGELEDVEEELDEDIGAVAYCRICSAGYREGVIECGDCGIPLEPKRMRSARSACRAAEPPMGH
jgi:hypothetical protein